MKYILLLFFLFFSSISNCFSQKDSEVSILYLLPFHLDIASEKVYKEKTEQQIYQLKPFEMMGFWFGSKLALKEFEKASVLLNVVVRDAVTDEKKMLEILDNDSLMLPIDIIIGPMYGSLFQKAAIYAEANNKIIINPFSTRFDFIQNNISVFKIKPPLISRPEKVKEIFLKPTHNYSVMLWGDSMFSPEMLAYKSFFLQHNIEFQEVSSMTLPSTTSKNKLVVAFFESYSKVLNRASSFQISSNANDVIIFPESWLNLNELTDDFFRLPNIYYFSDYFVDEKDDNVKNFIDKYRYQYNTPADLEHYSFQGYDITNYFIHFFLSNFDANKCTFKPICYQFRWQKIDMGGYENKETRLIQISGFEKKEIK